MPSFKHQKFHLWRPIHIDCVRPLPTLHNKLIHEVRELVERLRYSTAESFSPKKSQQNKSINNELTIIQYRNSITAHI
jgi:hypothetical protein